MSSPSPKKRKTKGKRTKKKRSPGKLSRQSSVDSVSRTPDAKGPDTKTAEATQLVRGLLKELSQAFIKQEHPQAKALVTKLKIAVLAFQLIPPFTLPPAVTAEQLGLARETLELATLLAVQEGNFKAFERNFAQAKAYYTDYGGLLLTSERQWQLFGLNLLGLLAHNRIAEFHTELELIPASARDNMYIKYPVELEQRLMEGNYSKVLRARARLPMPEYAFFTDLLATTVREKISDCCERAYATIPLEDALEMLMLEDKSALTAHISERGWQVEADNLVFTRSPDTDLALPAMKLARQTLRYATELERIV